MTDPVGFSDAMAARMHDYVDRALPHAQALESSNLALAEGEILSLADLAERSVKESYGDYLRAAVHAPRERQRREGYQLRQHIHLVPTTLTAQTDAAARDWVASRMGNAGGDVLERFHVIGGRGGRDERLFNDVRDRVLRERRNDIRIIIRFHGGMEAGGEAYIQARLAPSQPGEDPQTTRRAGRWKTFGTTIHEMLHAVTHEDFARGVSGLERSGIAVEGFSEYFTRLLYARLTDRARSDATLRTAVEGASGSFREPPARRAYESLVAKVEEIRDILGGNEENLKVAYFMGRIEYIGLGGWNETEAARRRYPGHRLGAAALLTTDGDGLLRLDYGHVLLGRAGALQLHLGGTMTYLTQGERLGLGGTVALQYSWPDVYVRGAVTAGGSASPGQPFTSSVRLDLMPGVEAGVRVGVVRIGVGTTLLIPVAGGPIDQRVVRLAAGVGASFDF
ncbi:MAG: hypothetical protein GEV03_22925 [Streptosporangiales bacterium]|nr:hypothetical protein [Streptosporangiales bacterium]